MPFPVNLTMTKCPEYRWQTGASLHKQEGASLRTEAASLGQLWLSAGHWLKACAKSPEQLGWEISHAHHENKAQNQMVPEARGSKEFLPTSPTSDAEPRSKALAVLKRLNVFHFTRHVLLLILGRRPFSLRERKCFMQLSSETLVLKMPHSKVRIWCLRAG